MKKVAVITGGSDGVGFSLVNTLAKNGYLVLTIGRSAEKLARLDVYAEKVKYISGDLTEEITQRKFIELVNSETSVIDVLINNAGFQIGNALLKEAKYTDIEAMLKIHLAVPFFLIQNFLEKIKNSGNPYIMNLVSVTVKNYLKETYGPYTISKYAEYGFGSMLVKELAKENVRVTNVILGGADTKIRSESRPEYLRADDIASVLGSLLETPKDVYIPEIFLSPRVQL